MKILKYFMSLAMAAGLMASCTKDLEEVQTYAPENVVAPSIHALDVNEVVITADNQTETLTFSWDAADYGAPTAINYAIMAAYNGTEVPVISGINELEYAVTYEALNAVVAFDLGCPLNEASDVAFRISASISSTYPTVYSESVTLKVTPTAAEKKYDMYYVIGSFNGWAHGTVAANYDFLYNFSGDGNTYEGIIDFREVGGAIEFKFTHGAAWGDGEMSAAEGQKELEEPSAVTLVAGGGDNIFAYGANRYYHFTLDVAGLTVTKNDAFDMIGVIGDFNSWGADVEMTYNAQKRRFYADVENLSGGFKFRANGGWDKNWGITDGKLGNGGDNIAVETAGNYRVYLYLSESANIYYELSADMYGVEGDGNTEAPVEPTPPAPEVEKGGKFIYVNNQDGWAATYLYTWNAAEGGESSGLTNTWPGKEMTVATTVNGVAYVGYEMPESTNGMSINYIFNNNDGTQTADPAAPIVLDRNYYFTIKDGVATEDVVEEVSYKLYADVTATGWENVNIWAWDADGNNYSGGNWPGVALSAEEVNGVTYYVFELPANVTGKTISVIFNNGTEQTVDLTGVVMDKDHTFTLTEKDASGKWLATIDGTEAPKPEEKVVVLGEHTWGLIGVNGDWSADVAMTLEQGWMVAKGVTFDAADSEFKVRADGGWDISYGTGKEYATVGGEAFTVTFNADNILLAEAGTYDIYFTIVDNVASMKVVAAGGNVTPEQPAAPAPLDVELGVVGDHTSWSTDSMLEWNGAIYVAKNVALEAGKGFKVRKAGVWDDTYNWGPSAATEIAVGGSLDVVCGSGAQNILVPATGTYDVYFDYAGLKVWLMTAGAEAPETSAPVTPEQPEQPEQPSTGVEIPADVQLGVVGDHTSWSSDSMMTLEGGYYVAKNVALEAGKGFKVRKAGAWDDAYNFGPSAGTEVAVNGSVDVINGSGSQNINVPATGSYDVYFDNKAMKVWLMEVGKTPAN